MNTNTSSADAAPIFRQQLRGSQSMPVLGEASVGGVGGHWMLNSPVGPMDPVSGEFVDLQQWLLQGSMDVGRGGNEGRSILG